MLFMTRNELSANEYDPYYQTYINRVETMSILHVLKENHKSIIAFIKSIESSKLSYRYAEGKWTVKEIILHIIDTERVFAYRALCIARKAKVELSGFDQDVFVAHSAADTRSIDNLLSEYESVRMATIFLFESFNQKTMTAVGIASNSPLSVRAAAYIIVGHEDHHMEIIKERYL